jgi:site-specific DNA recombinase
MATPLRRPGPTWSPSDLSGARLGIYTRASDDDEGTETSVTAQGRYGERWAASQGITDITKYCDNDLSASPFATKPREDFERLLADIAAGKLDLLWFWTLNRQQRRLDVYVQLRDLCRAVGVGWVIKKRVYDLNDPADLRALGNDAVNGEVFSLELSENVRLGTELAASQGKPHGPLTYGYRRIYDDRGRYVEQLPAEPQAAVVREIITRVSRGEPLIRLERDLTERGIPSPKGGTRWHRSVIRRIASNKAYIGIRVHEVGRSGEYTETPHAWGGLVDEDVFWRAQAALSQPRRTNTKPGRAEHLLSYIVRCECGEPVSAKVDRKRVRKAQAAEGRRMYACIRRCSGIGADELDDFVKAVVGGYLARDDVAAFFAAARANDAAAGAARAEVARLRVDLEAWRQMAESGEADPVTAARTIKGLNAKIKEAEQRAEDAATSPALRLGAVDWNDLAVARAFVAEVAEVTLHPAGKGRRHVPMDKRVTWRWLIGPDAS